VKSFRLPPSFRIELVAAEPEVVNPVAMTFDEAGRIYAVEMRDYPMGDGPPGRIRVLEDRDGDGRYETSSVFVDNLKLPNGVMRWRKGILVTSTPDILYFEDTNGDGKADVRQVVLTGFASQNPQLRLNGPQYGIDNWIYVAYTRRAASRRYARQFGDKGTAIRFPDRSEIALLDIHSRDIRFRPDQGKLEALAGYSQFGWGFNDWGDRFVVWNSDHIRHVPIDSATLARNPHLAIANPMESASDHKPQATVYPITENPLHIHDSQIGHFTSSCGLSVYTGGNLPAGFQNSSFTCEPVHNLVHRDILTPKGGTYVASRAYQNSEFLASTDAWFRPVFTMTGPDGAFYVVDYYRHSVEHPEFVPPELFKDLDFTSKPQKGRIWRVVHESSKKLPSPALDRASDQQLVEALSDVNQWWRLQAQRLLVDRQAKQAIPGLNALARSGSSPLGRLHALWTLDGLAALGDELVVAAMSGSDAGLRRHGIRLAADRLDRPSVRQQLKRLSTDGNTQVRYEAAMAIARLPEDEAFPLLQQIAMQDPGDPWLQIVVLSNARSDPMRWFRSLTSQVAPEPSFVQRIASLIGTRAQMQTSQPCSTRRSYRHRRGASA
jgi:putative membrane-bound dehydrogenase-like protein